MISKTSIRRALARSAGLVVCVAAVAMSAHPVAAQTADDNVIRIDLPTGRSMPVAIPGGVTRVTVANPDVADVLVASPTDVVFNGKTSGETDVMLWVTGGAMRHYRVQVRSPSDRMQILVAVKFAEVRRDALQRLGFSGLLRNADTRVGTGQFRNGANIDPVTDAGIVPLTTQFLTVLSDFGTTDFLAMLEVEASKGNARILAEPNIIAGNREEATFLAGGEVPIPIAQNFGSGSGGYPAVTIQYREFGVKLNFTGEIISDSLIRLHVRPEVSSLDYTNGVILSGFRIPALRTRRVESTLDVRRDQSLILSGLFNDERERVRTGVPFLMDVPILGALFSSQSWQRNETELLVIVTPMVVNPSRPGDRRIELVPERRLPAADVISPQMVHPPAAAPAQPARRQGRP